MKRLTYKQLQEDRDRCASDSSRTHLALNDVLNGEVEWFGLRPYRIGITRPCSAEGGLVIVRFNPPGQDGYASVYNWESWYPEIRDGFDPADKERQYLRALAFRAHEYVLRVQREHFEKKAVVV